MALKIKKFLSQKIYPSRSLFLRAIGWAFVPILGFAVFSFLTYPLKPHCSLGHGLLGCTPLCEPTSYFEDGRPAGYKTVPCYHEDPSNFQKILFNHWLLIPLFLFILFSLWIYKKGVKNVIKRLSYIAFAPIYIFKENRQNKNIVSRLLVIFILFFLFIEWALGYYVAGTILLGKEPFNFYTPPPQSSQITPPSFTGQDILDAVNKYRKENNVPELKLDEVLCNNIAQRYLDIKSGEKENIAHKGFDEWYKKYAEPYGYTVSENYACGQTPEDIIKAWSGSPSHNLSILDKKNKLACTYAAEGCVVILLGYKTATPQVKGTQIDNDPVVDCEIHPQCGGGSKKMRLSECNQMTCCLINEKCGGGGRFMSKKDCDQTICCQIGDKWYFYLDKNKCSEDQKNRYTSNLNQVLPTPSDNNSNKVPVFLSYLGRTIYCPPQNIDAVKSINQTMESKKQDWAKENLNCTNKFFETDPCHISCKNTMNSEWNNCTAQYGYSGEQYESCTNTASDNYSNCIKNCPSGSEYCKYVFSELRELLNQINNLCSYF